MLSADVNLKEMNEIIKDVKAKILKLAELSGGMQCVDRNCERMMAGIKMLEINISDVHDVLS